MLRESHCPHPVLWVAVWAGPHAAKCAGAREGWWQSARGSRSPRFFRRKPGGSQVFDKQIWGCDCLVRSATNLHGLPNISLHFATCGPLHGCLVLWCRATSQWPGTTPGTLLPPWWARGITWEAPPHPQREGSRLGEKPVHRNQRMGFGSA